jgi:hypothetical protein
VLGIKFCVDVKRLLPVLVRWLVRPEIRIKISVDVKRLDLPSILWKQKYRRQL